MDWGGCVLVADTHGLRRAGIAHIFQTHFQWDQLVETSNQAEFIGAWNTSSRIAVLVIDLELLGRDYSTAVREFTLRRPEMKLFVLAGSVDRKAMFDLLCAGAHGYIHKDLPASDLIAAIRAVLAGQIFVPAQIGNVISVDQEPENEHAIGSSTLTNRQHEVLRLLALGQSNKQIARTLNIAEGTVKVHVNGLFRALGVHNRVSAVTAAAKVSPSTFTTVQNYTRRATDRIHLLLLGGIGAFSGIFGDVVVMV